LLAPFDGSPRCNVAVAIGGEPDMQMVAWYDHIGADRYFLVNRLQAGG
jgi:hypothetical protein